MTQEQTNTESTAAAKQDKPPRPVLVVDSQTVSSQSMLLQRFFVGLTSEACDAALVCPASCDTDFTLSAPVELIRYPGLKLPLPWWPGKDKLVEKLAQFKPTVLHCLSTNRAGLTKKLAGLLDVPYVLTIDSLDKPLWRYSISTSRCAAIITPSRGIKTHLQSLYPALAERIEHINTGIFVEDSCTCFSVPGRIASMLTACRLRSLADFLPLFGAVRHLVMDGYEFVLMLTGTGPAERQIRKFIYEAGLSNIVYIVGEVRSLRSVFSGADIFIQPQPTVALNHLSLEAMSVGLAVAAARQMIDDDIFIPEQTAVTFDSQDELSIYTCLRSLLDDQEYARRLARQAQAHLKTNYSLTQMVTSLLETYRSAQRWLKVGEKTRVR